jgi:hypothetical protein
MSYAIRQFFLNGGSEAWVVRLAGSATAAVRTLINGAATNVLLLTALDEGLSGNNIEVRVDYTGDNPASLFNLTFNYISPDHPSENRSESFINLSMNSASARYVETQVNGVSQLVEVTRVASLAGLGSGTSQSGDLASSGTLLDVATLVDSTHNQFQVMVNGTAPVTVTITSADVTGGTTTQRLTALCAAIQGRVLLNAGTNPQLAGFTCVRSGNTILMTSGVAGENSSVTVLPGVRNDLAARLMLGSLNGGIETEAASVLRPVEMPDHGTLTSAVFGANDLDTLPDGTHTSFQISLDGYGPDNVNIGSTAAAGSNLAAKLADVAARIQAAVRLLKPSNPAYRDFTAAPNAGNDSLVLSSGTRGAGSSVVVNAAVSNSIAAELRYECLYGLHRRSLTPPGNLRPGKCGLV